MPRKLNYEKLQKIIEIRDGKCLGSIISSKTKVLWKCSEAHTWEATPAKSMNGRWCPICGKKNAAKKRRLNIAEMQEIAENRGGKCLTETYIKNHKKLLWECSQGHRWEATPHNIKWGTWCPTCAGKKKLSIEDMQYIAKERGGKCLSETYINSHTKLLWECSQGHRWEAPYGNIQQGHWCRKCSGSAKKSIRNMHELAMRRGGFCISKIYSDMHTPLLWQCLNGHKWKAKPNFIQQGRWCPECAGNTQKTIQDMKAIAEERGGFCLSSEYINNNTSLLWECSVGHNWWASPKSILRGSWCNYCSTGLGERICRIFFEELFDSKFPQSYPRWLINKAVPTF